MGGICFTVHKEVRSHVFVSHGQEREKPGLSRANIDTGKPSVGGGGGPLTHLQAEVDQFERARVTCALGVRYASVLLLIKILSLSARTIKFLDY